MKEVNIYITTSVKSISKKKGTGGFIIECGTDTWKRFGPVTETQNGAEVVILDAALKKLPVISSEPCRLILWLETSYVAAAISKGKYRKWEELCWHNNKGQQIRCMEQWQQIADALKVHEVAEVHCNEHHSFSNWMENRLKELEKE